MERRSDIDRAKGLAILLVVFGHLVARADPAGVHWYEPMRHAVYSFHMPFFFYLSGYVLMLSGGALAPGAGWLARRARRLLIPFAALGLLVVVGKYFGARWMFVDHAPAGLMAGVSGLVWHTGDSAAESIWYLFVLFGYGALAPVLLRGEARRLRWVLAAAALLFFIPLPDYVYADRFGRYAVFFVVGLTAAAHEAAWWRFLAFGWRVWLAVLGLLCVAVGVFGAGWQSGILLPAGLCAIPALHGLVRFSWASSSRSLLWLGRYCFMIYLFNTMFIGLAKAVLLHLADWNGSHFLPFAMCLMLSGIFGPVALKRLAFQRLARLDRLTD